MNMMNVQPLNELTTEMAATAFHLEEAKLKFEGTFINFDKPFSGIECGMIIADTRFTNLERNIATSDMWQTFTATTTNAAGGAHTHTHNNNTISKKDRHDNNDQQLTSNPHRRLSARACLTT